MISTLEKPSTTDIYITLRDAANNILSKIQDKICFVQAFTNEENQTELWLFIADGKPRMQPVIICSGDSASEAMLKFRNEDFLQRVFGQYTKYYSYHMVQALFNHYCEIAESYSGQRFLMIDNSGVR